MGEIFFNSDFMIKYYLGVLISLLFFNQSLAKNINIQENVNFTFKCELEKKIIKNSEYNYQVFLAKDLKEKDNAYGWILGGEDESARPRATDYGD